MEVIYLQHLLIQYLEKYYFFKITDANSIFADMLFFVAFYMYSFPLKFPIKSKNLQTRSWQLWQLNLPLK